MPSFDPMVVDTVLIPAFKQNQCPTTEFIQRLIDKFELPHTPEQLYTWFKNRRRYPHDHKRRAQYELHRDMKEETRTGTRRKNIMRGVAVTVLQQHFENNMHPSTADIAGMCEQLLIKHNKRINPEQISTWFKNRRCKLRLMAASTHTLPKKASQPSTRSEYYSQRDLRRKEMLQWVDSVWAC